MTAEITTVVGQLSLVGGAWRGDAPNQVAVREPKSAGVPGAGKGDLFVLVEARGEVAHRHLLERQLAETVRDAYYLARGSITASLRRALQAAGDLLYERNYDARPEERLIAGVVALVMSGEDAFVAQIGPAACFAVLGDYIRRYPTQSVWLDEALDPAEDENEAILGRNLVIEPNLHHLRVSPRDVLVLADSRLARQLPLADVVKSVEGRGVKSALKNLARAAQTKDGSALVVAIVEQTPPATLGPIKVTPPSSLSRFLPGGQGGRPVPTGPPLGASPKSGRVVETVAQAEPVVEQVQATPALTPMATTQPAPEKSSSMHAFARKKPLEHRPKVADGLQGRATAARQAPPKPSPAPEKGYNLEQRLGQEAKTLASMAHEPNFRQEYRRGRPKPSSPPVGKILRWLVAGPLILIALLGNSLKAIFNLVLPGINHQAPRQAGMQAHRSQSSPISLIVLRNIAIAIPLLVGLIVGISYLQKGRLREAEYRELVDTAQSKVAQAQAVDRNSAVALFAEAEGLLVQAEQIKPDQPEIAELRQKMADDSDRLGNVQRLYYLPQLRQYTDTGTNLKQIIVQGVEIYVLDGGNNRILHHRLDDRGEALLADDESLLLTQQGQVVDEVTVGPLLGMTWMPAGGNRQTSDLLILSSSGLLEYNPNWGITTSNITGGEALALPVAVSSFFGNFYVLDPQANKLLRYLPTADGYSAPPESYFAPELGVDLSRAVDFAIDGAIYVLFNDGHISKYLSGQPAGDFNVRGLDQPFNRPVAIFTAPNEEVQHLYVADAGNQRIVQLNKDGSFVRQFKPRLGEAVSFANLQDIFVDEIGARIYILDSNNLYLANIPNE